MKLAIETYSELSGMAINDVKAECLKDTPVRKSVMMLMFTSSIMHEELQNLPLANAKADSSAVAD